MKLKSLILETLNITFIRHGKREFVYHVTKLSIYLELTVHYNNTKITPILSIRIVLSCFYLLITHLLKYIFLGTRFNKARGQEPQSDKQRDNFLTF